MANVVAHLDLKVKEYDYLYKVLENDMKTCINGSFGSSSFTARAFREKLYICNNLLKALETSRDNFDKKEIKDYE